MQNRIDRLENLVLSLMTNGSKAAGAVAAHAIISSSRSNSIATPGPHARTHDPDSIREVEGEDSDIENVSQGIGIMKVMDNGKSIFASDAHWYAILADVSTISISIICLSLTHYLVNRLQK